MWQFISEHFAVNADGIGVSWACVAVLIGGLWIMTLIQKTRPAKREQGR